MITRIVSIISIVALAGVVNAAVGVGDKQIRQIQIPGEYIAATTNLKALAQALPESTLEKVATLKKNKQVWVKLKGIITGQVGTLEKVPGTLWIAPNYKYEGDPREEVNDPQFRAQYHHKIMQNAEAWADMRQGAEIVVAVTDDGVDLEHEDLKNVIWHNEGEIPNNNKDDDGNGYVDDHEGWDFSSGDNDPRPGSRQHGTHVAGIVAAEINNGKGVAGTSPNVKIMALRFYGSGSWTSDKIAATYAYAADNGAHIITTSYNINGFVNDRVFKEGVAYAYDQGTIHFNSAGNGYEKEPARVIFKELILTCSTIADNRSNDKKSDFSNWGVGVDICAPGGGGSSGILATINGNSYGRKSGTSMAAPNAAAVAANIWSQNPDWTRDQVMAQLYSTADNINNQNPTLVGGLGAGRVNSLRAVTEETAAPTLSARISGSYVEVTIKRIFDPESFETRGAFQVVNVETGAEYDLEFTTGYKMGTNIMKARLPNLGAGRYQFRAVSELVTDPFGIKLDGNTDGKSGDDYVLDFQI